MRRRLVRWWIERTQCRHNKLVGQLLDDNMDLYGALLAIQGWSSSQLDKGGYVLTQLGSHTFTFPIVCADSHDAFVVLTLGVINQTPIYGVMAFQVGETLVSYRDFPLEARLRLQMCPSYQDVVLLFETEIVPHIKNITDGKPT